MTDWQDVPRFGDCPEGVVATLRPSAYGFLRNAGGAIAVVRAPDGVFLPGGGIDPGETPGEALVREALEECGLLVRVASCVARATQFTAVEGGRTFEKQCLFFEVEVLEERPESRHPGHETLWVEPAAAAGLFSHPSQAWAVRKWIELSRPE